MSQQQNLTIVDRADVDEIFADGVIDTRAGKGIVYATLTTSRMVAGKPDIPITPVVTGRLVITLDAALILHGQLDHIFKQLAGQGILTAPASGTKTVQ